MRRRKRFIPLARIPLHGTGGLAQAPELDALLQPARTYGRPAAVLQDPTLSLPEKRAILASWASDACAMDSAPTLRRPAGLREPVSFEEVMEALRSLDAVAQGGDRREVVTKAGAGESRPA